MNILIDILLAVLLTAGTAFCIFAILYLRRITDSIEQMNQEVKTVSTQLPPVLNSIRNMSDSITNIGNNVNQQIDKIEWIVDEIKKKAQDLFAFEQKVRNNAENPIITLINNLQAIREGVKAFWKSYKK